MSKNPTKNPPEFKPGNEPHLEYDGTVLNANVPWHEVVSQIMAEGITATAIAEEAGLSLQTINNILKEDYHGLYFKAGARLITIQYRVCLAQDW
jgi:lambda repressor-like predicted transcriptional regulator